ncbi:amidohydrolase family protein, partial [Escherichia coli]
GVPWVGTPSERARAVSVQEVIEMATINGAIAMGIGDITGSITEGKRADIILVRAKDLNIWPIGNIETAIVQSGSASNVDTVLVDGRIIKRSGRLLAYNVDSIVRGAQQSSNRILNAADEMMKL